MAFPEICVAAAIGMNVHLPPSDTLDLAKDGGAEWVRIDFNWDIAEATQGTYDWTVFDGVLDAAKARGLNVFATIGYGPAWASTGDALGDGPTNDVPNAAAYAAFVKAAATRYADGRVAAWGTWNEPNLEQFFEGTMQQWIDSAFIPAVDAIKEGCPSCLIVGPEVATISDEYDDYLKAALQARGPDLDAVSWHIYAAFPEDDPQAGLTKDSFYNKLEEHRVIEIGGTVVYEGPLSAREVMTAEGYANLPLWITETGQEAVPADAPELEAQRKYYERVLVAASTRPWWQRTFFYELTEEHPNGMWPDIHWGVALRVADPDATFADNFETKPAFEDLKACIAAGPPVGGTGGVGGSGTGGSATGGSAGVGGMAGATSGGAAGSAGAAARPDSGEDSSGCGCSVPATESSAFGLAWIAVLGLLRRAFTRRRV
jgi:MYXO-CTERM domain-containing protein